MQFDTQTSTSTSSRSIPSTDKVARLISIISLIISLGSLCWDIYIYRAQHLERQAELALRPVLKTDLKIQLFPKQTSASQSNIIVIDWSLVNNGKEDIEINIADVKCGFYEASSLNGSVVNKEFHVIPVRNQFTWETMVLFGGEGGNFTGAREISPGFYYVTCEFPVKNWNNLRTKSNELSTIEIEQYLYVPLAK